MRQKFKMSFYMTLPSNVKTNATKNAVSHYRTTLVSPIYLDGDYEVALVEASFPRIIVQEPEELVIKLGIMACLDYNTIRLEQRRTRGKRETSQKTIDKYVEIEELDEMARIYRKGIKRPPTMGAKRMELLYYKEHKRFVAGAYPPGVLEPLLILLPTKFKLPKDTEYVWHQTNEKYSKVYKQGMYVSADDPDAPTKEIFWSDEKQKFTHHPNLDPSADDDTPIRIAHPSGEITVPFLEINERLRPYCLEEIIVNPNFSHDIFVPADISKSTEELYGLPPLTPPQTPLGQPKPFKPFNHFYYKDNLPPMNHWHHCYANLWKRTRPNGPLNLLMHGPLIDKFSNVKQIIEAINREFTEFALKHPNKPSAKFELLSNGIVKVVPGYMTKLDGDESSEILYYPLVDEPVASMLGLSDVMKQLHNDHVPYRTVRNENNVIEIKTEKDLIGSHAAIMPKPYEYLMYSNLPKHSICGDNFYQLLRRVDIPEGNGTQCSVIYTHPYYMPLATNPIVDVVIEYRDDEGKYAKFADNTRSCVVLHFRKVIKAPKATIEN